MAPYTTPHTMKEKTGWSVAPCWLKASLCVFGHVYFSHSLMQMYAWVGPVRLSWVCFVFVRSGNNIILQTGPQGSRGIVGNWKSRWTCMSFQEDTVTTEIETKHTRYNVNGAHLRLCTSLFFTAASFLFSYLPHHSSSSSSFSPPCGRLINEDARDGTARTERAEWKGPPGSINKVCTNELSQMPWVIFTIHFYTINPSCPLWGTTSSAVLEIFREPDGSSSYRH